MRIHFIEDDNKKVMFFPDSLRFYKINDISKEIVEKFNFLVGNQRLI